MFTFLLYIYYNYNGDSMKDRQELILSLQNIEDIKKLEKDNNIKYINIDITNPNKEIIDYLIKNGQDLLYAEIINHQKG